MIPEFFQSIPDNSSLEFQVNKGEFAFRQDEATRGLFYVLKGVIELRRFTESGEMILVHRAVQGETFAEASLFTEKYHCDAVATVESRLIELNAKYALAHLHTDPKFSAKLTKHLAKQNQFYRRKIELLAIKNATERVHSALIDNLLQGNIVSFATEIGLTHETVYRSLRKLVDQGRIIQTGRGKYQIRGRETGASF
jgi:CRP-like cAMP-binding protein